MSELQYEVFSGDVIHFPRAIPNAQEIIDLTENNKGLVIGEWLPWYANADTKDTQYGLMKKINRQDLETEPDADIKAKALKILTSVDNVVAECFKIYHRHLGLSEEIVNSMYGFFMVNRSDHYAVKKYFVEQGLGPHPDWDSEDPIGLTFAVYLNDDYDGGELNFPYNGITIPSTPGSVVIFPSVYFHQGMTLNSGVKYFINEVAVIPRNMAEQSSRVEELEWMHL